MMRFEGLPGEFSQHNFGEVRITCLDGSREVVRFFGSRLKWSRWAVVTLVPNPVAEPLIRTLADHFVAFGGVPLCAVFDRPKTVALKWAKNGEVTEWNPIFAYAALAVGFTAVGWVKGSFFKQRRFHDRDDLQTQFAPVARRGEQPAPQPSHRRDPGAPPAAGVAPPARLARESRAAGPAHTDSGVSDRRGTLRRAQLRHAPGGGRRAGTLFLYREHVHIVAGRYQAQSPRFIAKGTVARQPEHRAAQLAAISGKRGRRYLQREHLLDTGAAALPFLTTLVHRAPHSSFRDVEVLHDLLQQHGPKTLDRAFQAAVAAHTCTIEYVVRSLNGDRSTPTTGSTGTRRL